MKNKAIIPLVIGLAVGLVAIKYTMDTNAAKGDTGASELTTVVMARQDIPSTVAITAEMLVAIKAPKTPLLPSGGFSKIEDLVGRVAFKSIPQGSAVLPSTIAPKGTLPGLMVRVKEGYRAVAVKTDESSGVAYLVHPGDWVDVLVVMDVKKNGKKETISRVILQRVQVGAVGQMLNDGLAESTGKQAKTITLLVKEEDVPRLHLAQTRGRITLAMRGSNDMVIGDPAETNEAETFGFKQENRSSTTPVVSSWLSGLMKAVASKKPPKEPQPQLQPPVPAEPESFTVMVVNGSATENDAKKTVKRMTYRDDHSMEIVRVENGDSPVGRRQVGSRKTRSAETDAGSRQRDLYAEENGLDIATLGEVTE